MAEESIHAAPSASGPIRVAVLDDHELVTAGVASMLAPHSDRVHLVECGPLGSVDEPVDIALYDAFEGIPATTTAELEMVAYDARVRHLVLYTWNVCPTTIDYARDHRLCGVISKAVSGSELLDALEQVQGGSTVVHAGPGDTSPGHDEGQGWPGQDAGLTPRQSQIIALITSGLTNQQIAHASHLSINSVKSYIRAAYRTMGVTSRSQAVLWGIEHGGFRRDSPDLTPGPSGCPRWV